MRSWSENLCRVLTVLRHVCIDRELYCTPVEADFEDFTLADLLGKRSKCAVRCDLLRSILQLLYCAVYGHYLNIICLHVVRVLKVLLLFVHFHDRIAFLLQFVTS